VLAAGRTHADPKEEPLRIRTCLSQRTTANEEERLKFPHAGPVRTPTAILLLCLANGFALAQQRPDAGQLLEQTREPLRLPAPAEPVVPRPPEPAPALPVSPQLRVVIRQFTFTGNTLFSDLQLRTVTDQFLGKELDFEGLNDVATAVRAYYRSRGYFLAQAYLPEQSIRHGVAQIGIIEGRIGQLQVDSKPGLRIADSLLVGMVGSHLQQGQVITEKGLERPLLLINDLPGAQVTSEIRPSRTVGAADIRVNVDQIEDAFTGFVDADNHGNRFTGEYRIGANLNWNTPLHYGDQATFRGFVSDEEMWYARFAYLMPVGFRGTRVGLSYSKFDYRLTKDFASLQANGEGEVKNIYAFHPIVRTRNSNFIAQVSYEDKRLIDRVESTASVEQRGITNWKIGAVGDFRDGSFSGGLNAYSFTYTVGDLQISPPSVAAADVAATGRKTSGDFRKTNLDLRRLQRVSDRVSLLLAFSGQLASKNLASAEKFSLGGPNGVRAYPVGEATADDGALVTGELRYIIPGTSIFGGDFTVSSFIDYGRVKLNHDPLPTDTDNDRELAGYGVGLSAGREGSFIVRSSVAWRLTRSDPQSDTAERWPRLWVQGVKWF
jgi:hemolysin activation/secretion protein